MPRSSWRRNEIQILVDNYKTKTTDELCKLIPRRSRKSINRKIEQLRAEGRVDYRSDETVRRAYNQRKRRRAKSRSENNFVEEEMEIVEDFDDEYEEI